MTRARERDALWRQLEAAIRRNKAKSDIQWRLKLEHGATDDQLWAFALKIRKEGEST